jgi:copper chaperone CopZ
MKKLKVVGITMIMLGVMSVSAQKVTKWSEVLVQTDGHGQHCKDRIEGSISYEKGVKDVDYELSSAKVKITYDSTKTSSEMLINALKKLGYTVSTIPDSGTKTNVKTSQPSKDPDKGHPHQ